VYLGETIVKKIETYLKFGSEIPTYIWCVGKTDSGPFCICVLLCRLRLI
jgi:hypothetical protein